MTAPRLLVAVVALTACGTTTQADTPTSPPATVTIGPLPTAPELVADATAVARRVTTTSVAVEQAAPVDWAVVYAGLPCTEWAGLAREVGWPHEEMPKLLRTMWRESRCQPEVRSKTSDSGLCQINDIVLRDWRFLRDFPIFYPVSLFDPRTNLTVALWLWRTEGGWGPWRGGA